MGITTKPRLLGVKSKKITKLSPVNNDLVLYWMAMQRRSRDASLDADDWRTQLLPASRRRVANKIMDKLKRHLPFTGREGLNELKKIALRFEEKIYGAATSQSDYLRRISLKMLSLES